MKWTRFDAAVNAFVSVGTLYLILLVVERALALLVAIRSYYTAKDEARQLRKSIEKMVSDELTSRRKE